MKKLAILQTMFSFLTLTTLAQVNDEDCSQYINTIDSLIKTGNLYIYKYNHPSIACEYSLLGYTKGKGFLGDSISTDIREILNFLSLSGNLQTARETAINELLVRNYAFNVNLSYRVKKSDYNRQAWNRMATLLRKQYTDEEIKRYVNDMTFAVFKDTIIVSLRAHEAVRKRNMEYYKAKDSITHAIIHKYERHLYERGYSINLPLLIGWHNMREFIPLLDSIQNAGQGGVHFQLALARMGNKKYQEYLLKADKVNPNVAFYVGTQELIAKYGEELYSEEKRCFLSISGPPGIAKNETGPIVYNEIIWLQKNLSGFPMLIDRHIIYSQAQIDALPPGTLEIARQWMKENTGKYIVSPEFYPDFTVYSLDEYEKRLKQAEK